METLKVLNYSNVFLASYFVDTQQCSHQNREHTLIYLQSGELEITERGKTTLLREGECAFIRRDNQVTLTKRVKEGKPYHSLVLKFSRNFLREFYQRIDKESIPEKVKRNNVSLYLLPAHRPDITSLFESVIPYLDSDVKPSEELLNLKMAEGVFVLLHTDLNLYASLFDFTEPWKIDILSYMHENYMYDLSLEEMANYTGRSLATFKRDFKKASNLTPQKWLINKRMEVAHELLQKNKNKKVTEVCFDVGFKNLSHFSKIYKETYGYTPTNSI